MIEERTVIRERRRGKRARKSVNCVILTEDASFDLKGKTNDLSCIGANCKMNMHIPEMTRLRLSLELDSGIQTFEGMVVRCDKQEDKVFDTAIYFTNIDMGTRNKIDDFINGRESNHPQEFRIDG